MPLAFDVMLSQREHDAASPAHTDTTAMLAGSTIAARAQTCHDLLICSVNLLHDDGIRWARLRGLTGQFNMWTSNMGALAVLHASLDYRLRDLVDVKELILEQLEYMMDGIERLIALLEFAGPETTSTGPAKDTERRPLSQSVWHEKIDTILSSLTTSIEWLYRSANMIRRASFLRQNAKASTFPLNDALDEDTRRLFRYWILRDFPGVEDDLCERLISTMLLRRRRIMYRRSRQVKLVPHKATKPAEPTVPPPSAINTTDFPQQASRVVSVPSGVASTQYTATTVDPEVYRQVTSAPSRVSEAHTVAMTMNDKDIIPPPPRLEPMVLEFICPFCRLILPASEARDRATWAAHVKKDLDPYVCAFFPCTHGNNIYTTSADWISHEQTHCMRWYCATKTHRSLVFLSPEEFIVHMKTEHPGKFEDSKLQLVANSSRRPLKNIFEACPLCGEEQPERDGISLENHVANHLQHLALLSLPLYDDVDEKWYDKVCSAQSHSEGKLAASRTTVQSKKHGLPSPVFTDDDRNHSTTVSAVADTWADRIPDMEGESRMSTSQLWQTLRMEKAKRLDAANALTKREQMDAWLSPADHTTNQREAQQGRQEGSGRWIFDNEQFSAWKKEPGSLLWLNGVPGCGRTLLTSTIIDGLQEHTSNHGISHTILYFYFDFADNQKQSMEDASRSLLSQLYSDRPQSQQHLDVLWSSYNDGREQPSALDLVGTFEKMLRDAGEVWIILDALDECQSPHDDPRAPELLTPETWLENLNLSENRVHLLVTSRDTPSIRLIFGGFATFHLPDSVYDLSNDGLETKIRGSLLACSGKQREKFLPIDKLDKIITLRGVHNELARTLQYNKSHHDLQNLAHKIWDEVEVPDSALTTRRKIFAILVYINKAACITDFIEENLYDCHLPFSFVDSHPNRSLVYRKTRLGTDVPIDCFSKMGWKILEREHFQQYQWWFQAPYFEIISGGKRRRPLHYALDDRTIFPFIEDSEEEDLAGPSTTSGRSSDVWRVRIHPAHHSHDPTLGNPPASFAIKRLKPNNRNAEDFKREVATLKRLSGQNHAHLIKLEVTYLYQDRYHLLFSWADGNLRDYWQAHPKPSDVPKTREYAVWVASQWLGLARGLLAIHHCPPDEIIEQDDEQPSDGFGPQRINGRHGDIKPENILWFHSRKSQDNQPPVNGKLVICDFGLTEFHRLETEYVNPPTVARSPTYRAPEYDISGTVSQSYDIWTLGCVLLEFIVWYLQGFDAVDQFSADRTTQDNRPIPEDVYFTIHHNHIGKNGKIYSAAVLKDSVSTQINTLRQDPNVTSFIVDALDFIEQRMLEMNPEKRATCDEAVAVFEMIFGKTSSAEKYCVHPVPGKLRRTAIEVSMLVWQLVFDPKTKQPISISEEEVSEGGTSAGGGIPATNSPQTPGRGAVERITRQSSVDTADTRLHVPGTGPISAESAGDGAPASIVQGSCSKLLDKKASEDPDSVTT